MRCTMPLAFVAISIWTFECLKPLSSSLILTIYAYKYYVFTYAYPWAGRAMELCSDICMGCNLNFKLPNIIHVLCIVNVCMSAVIFQKCFHFSHPKNANAHRWPQFGSQFNVIHYSILMNETWNIYNIHISYKLVNDISPFYLKIPNSKWKHHQNASTILASIWRMKSEKEMLEQEKKKKRKMKMKIPKKSCNRAFDPHTEWI